MANNCNSLKYVCLANCSLLTDNCLVALAEQCHQLNTLEVAGCSQFTDIGFLALSKVINYCTDFINFFIFYHYNFFYRRVILWRRWI